MESAIDNGMKQRWEIKDRRLVPTPEDVQFGDETLWAYEGGFKIDVFDRRARVNTAVFYYDYNDFQAFNWTGLAGSVTNADIAEHLAALALQIDKRQVQLEEPIKQLGEYTVPVRIHRDVVATVRVRVVREGDDAGASD